MATTLHHELVHEEGAQPARWLYAMHGIFGSGRNWASVVRRIVRARPEWGALLIDLRQHGASHGFDPPHTIVNAAHDLAALAESSHLPPDALLGHSFGGKVALLAAGLPQIRAHLRQVWVIDSTPEARPAAGSAWQMYQTLQSLPDRFASREQAIEQLVSRGTAPPVAEWMATNLHAREGQYGWRFDLDDIGALLQSFFDTDAWEIVERPPADMHIHLVRASESSVMETAMDRARRAAAGGRVHLHEVAGGHWLNADNPDALVALLTEHLPS